MSDKKSYPRFISGRATAAAGIGVGSRFEARVLDLSETGNAVVEHPSGRRFFVAGAWLGEQIRVRVKEVKSQFGFGDLVEVLEPSPARLTPPCPFHGYGSDQCGGCSWMFVTYAAQLQAKQLRVKRALARVQADVAVQPILAAPNPLGYRVRAQLKTDGEKLGFVANGQRQLAAVTDCLILTDHNRRTLTDLQGRLPNSEWVPNRKQDWTTLNLDESITADQVSVNRRLPFQQANAEQNQIMRDWLAKHLAQLPKTAPVVELFAGSGNFTQVIAAAGFTRIHAVEVVAEAVQALDAQQLPGVATLTCNLFDETQSQALWQRLSQEQCDPQILVLDPPRDGLKNKTGLFRKKSPLRDVFYISCDLATLCRDLQAFCDAGFQLLEVQPIDLFPQTPHVELLVHLRHPSR